MSDHRSDLAERDLSGSPSVSLDEAQAMLQRRWQSDGEVRQPAGPDEAGALLVRIPIFSVERVAYFERGDRARLVYLDRASQPRGRTALEPARLPERAAAQPGPLFGTPGCAVPACDPEPPSTPAAPLKLVCSKCGKPPPPDLGAIEGGTHYLVRHRNDASRPKVDFKRTHTCGKWRRAG